MLKPHLPNDEIPFVFLPFVRDTINLSQSQIVVEGLINLALDGWNTTDWGLRTDFWKYLVTHYGHYRVMKQFTELHDGYLICDEQDFNAFAKPVFASNYAKYTRLAKSLESTYDPLRPYDVMAEESSGSKNAKLSTTYATHSDTNYETSMDSTTQQPAGKIEYGNHTDDVQSENNLAIDFEGNAYLSNMGTVAGMKNHKYGNLGNLTYADIIDKEAKLAKYSLWDIIAKDILDNGCLKIFESC